MRYSTQPRERKYIEEYGFSLSQENSLINLVKN